eukprot:6178729-Pleurochrysis_carterae.AAC.2
MEGRIGRRNGCGGGARDERVRECLHAFVSAGAHTCVCMHGYVLARACRKRQPKSSKEVVRLKGRILADRNRTALRQALF